MKTQDIPPLAVRLPPKVRAAIERLAHADGRSLNNYLVRVIVAHVTEQRP